MVCCLVASEVASRPKKERHKVLLAAEYMLATHGLCLGLNVLPVVDLHGPTHHCLGIFS